MRIVVRSLGALAIVVAAVASLQAADPPQNRPNIVFILLDNCGQEWLGCYGSDEKRTPNIDALARQGVRFENCYTPPVCGPSRIVLLTGRYPFRTGFTLHHDAALYSGGGLDPAHEVLFPRVLRSAGYATGIAGKWQVNNLYDQPDALTRHGFDEHLVWPGSIDRDLATSDELRRFQIGIQNADVETTSAITQKIESRYWNPVLLRNGRREVNTGKYGPDVLQEFAFDFLSRHRNDPFLLYYPMVLTHGQTHTQPVVPTPLNRETGRDQHQMYGEMVQYADRLVGDLVTKLDQLGLRERTIVFVATDNGTESRITGHRNGQEARGGLYELTEAGSNVGLIANCPKLIPGGRTVALADFSDIYPTVCEFTGAHVPSELTLDGRSQAAILRGLPGAKPPRDWIFDQYHTRRMVRDERYKLYSTGELYDVSTDRAEKHNLADSKDSVVRAAREKLANVLTSFPPDARPRFRLLSQSAFKLRTAGETVGEP